MMESVPIVKMRGLEVLVVVTGDVLLTINFFIQQLVIVAV